jgi:hypothetical protein
MSATPLQLGPFTGGVNLVDPPIELNKDELWMCRNIRIGRRGTLTKRPGHGNYGTAPAKMNGDTRVLLNARYYRADGTRMVIAGAGGKLFKGDDVSGAWTAIDIDGTPANIMSTVELASWMVYKDRMYIADGTKPQRYNGTDNIYAGLLQPPTPTCVGATTGGGLLTLLATYKYIVTCVQGDLGEGPGSPVVIGVSTVTLTGTQNSVNISGLVNAAAKYGQTAKRIYRTAANLDVYHLLTEITGASGATTYTDLIVDTALGVDYVAVEAPPTDARYVIMGFDDRAYWFGMAGVNASLVKVSDVGFPDRIISSTGFFAVQNNDNDILTGVGKVAGGLVFFKRNSCWLSRGFGYGLINIQPSDNKSGGVGTVSPYSCTTSPNGLTFLSQKGKVFNFDGTNLQDIGQGIQSEFTGMTETALSRVVAAYHADRYILSYDQRNNKGYNWRTLEYDLINNKWEGPHENGDFYNPSCYCTWDSKLDKGELTWGEARIANGSYLRVRTEFTKNDRGNKIYGTAGLSIGPLGMLADVLTLKLFIHCTFSNDADLRITHIDDTDGREQQGLITPLLITPAKWDSGVNWGLDAGGGKWGGNTSAVVFTTFDESRATSPRLEITDGGATELGMNMITGLVEVLPLA